MLAFTYIFFLKSVRDCSFASKNIPVSVLNNCFTEALQYCLKNLPGVCFFLHSSRLTWLYTESGQDTFRAYCANKPDLDGKSFVKLCKDCEIVDDVFTQIDADLIFAKVVTKGHRRITLHQLEVALRMMAQKKGVEEDDIFRRVAESEGVLHAGTQADYVRFFDDKSTYTGTHLYGGLLLRKIAIGCNWLLSILFRSAKL